MPDPVSFRAQFPVLDRVAYLNSGTEGPVPRAAAEAVRERLQRDLLDGRTGRAYFDQVMELAAAARAGYASVLGCEPDEVALTGSTTDGCNTVLGGMRFAPGEEILTSDEEHPGLLAPLRLARIRHGVSVRAVPFDALAAEVTERTRLVACSHVSWVGGKLVDMAGLRATGVPVLLDGAQGIGAVPTDVNAMGCDFYAGSGQKWLCGPEGSGCLYVKPERLAELEPPWPGYSTLADHDRCLESPLSAGTARLDHGFPSAVRSTWAVASLRLLEEAGWGWLYERAASKAAHLAGELEKRDLRVAPRGDTTLVSWSPTEDPDAEVARLATEGVVVRSIPGAGLIRASVGAWTSDDDLARLLAAISR